MSKSVNAVRSRNADTCNPCCKVITAILRRLGQQLTSLGISAAPQAEGKGAPPSMLGAMQNPVRRGSLRIAGNTNGHTPPGKLTSNNIRCTKLLLAVRAEYI